MEQKHVMIDIETFDVVETAVITEIAAQIVNVENGIIEDTFNSIIDIDSQKGRSISGKTLQFWQMNKMFERYFYSEKIDIIQALENLNSFIPENALVWANSPQFDLSIIKHAMRMYGITPSWFFYNERDLRTLKSFYPQKTIHIPNFGTNHVALDDCNYQCHVLCRLYQLR